VRSQLSNTESRNIAESLKPDGSMTKSRPVLCQLWLMGLTYEAEPRRIKTANRDSGTDAHNRRWLRRIVRRHLRSHALCQPLGA
jgi:hypothetical protein